MTQDNRAGVIRRGKARASVDPRLRSRSFLKPVPTGQCTSRCLRPILTRHLMKYIILAVAAAFLAGCAAAPPPVKIASKLLGRNVLHQAKDEVFNSDNDQDATTP